MIYKNGSIGALLAMESARTGDYGDCYGSAGKSFSCPCCGAVEPDSFFVNDSDECVGCAECVYVSDTPWG